MPNVSDYLKFAETAFASYADGLSLGNGMNLAAYSRAGMATAQAQRFDSHWQVLG